MDKGFGLAKTTEIAEEAGVTHAMLHYYFRTKEKLFEQVFRVKISLMAHSLEATFNDNKHLFDQLADLIGTHFDFLAANPRLPQFILNEIHLSEERREVYLPLLLEALAKLRKNVEIQLEKALNRGEIRPIRTVDFLFMVLSLNVMSFMAQPIVQTAFYLNEEEQRQFLSQRRAENIETVLSRLRK
ncbi:MAG: TetR/AcrR family transcriptional regulator [Paraprevotella sp.]|nr:TetR/AcrR family transcriptional regulator [Paraprevotella sp.]